MAVNGSTFCAVFVIMKTQCMLFALTAANMSLLLWQVIQPRGTEAEEIAPILRGRELQLLDHRGRVRAEIKVLPADPAVKMPDGTTGTRRRSFFGSSILRAGRMSRSQLPKTVRG